MSGIAAKKSNHITRTISAVERLLANISELKALRLEAGDLGMGYLTGGANALVDSDFVGENAHVTAAHYNAAFAALVALSEDVEGGSPSVMSILYRLHR